MRLSVCGLYNFARLEAVMLDPWNLEPLFQESQVPVDSIWQALSCLKPGNAHGNEMERAEGPVQTNETRSVRVWYPSDDEAGSRGNPFQLALDKVCLRRHTDKIFALGRWWGNDPLRSDTIKFPHPSGDAIQLEDSHRRWLWIPICLLVFEYAI